MNPTEIGIHAEAAVLSALVRTGYTVLTPFGGGRRYDLVIELDGRFYTVQCKAGRYNAGAVVFNTASVQRDTHKRTQYENIDYFGIYCSTLGTVYLVPVKDVGTGVLGSLRVEPCRNGQVKRTRPAEPYLVL